MINISEIVARVLTLKADRGLLVEGEVIPSFWSVDEDLHEYLMGIKGVSLEDALFEVACTAMEAAYVHQDEEWDGSAKYFVLQLNGRDHGLLEVHMGAEGVVIGRS